MTFFPMYDFCTACLEFVGSLGACNIFFCVEKLRDLVNGSLDVASQFLGLNYEGRNGSLATRFKSQKRNGSLRRFSIIGHATQNQKH
jgi:hypothetical protein